MPITFFNSFEKNVLGISECIEDKTKVQFLMHTFKEVFLKKYKISEK